MCKRGLVEWLSLEIEAGYVLGLICYVGMLEVSFACVSVKTNVDSSNANKGVKRTKVTGVWVVTSCDLTFRHRATSI